MTAKPVVLYVHSFTDVVGVAGAPNVYLSVFNPVGSGKVMGIVNVLVQPYSVGAASVASSFNFHRISAASGGTLIAASTVIRFDPLHPDPAAEVRQDNPTVTTVGNVIGGTAPPVGTGLGTNAPLAVSAPAAVPFLCRPGQGVCFRTQDADIDTRWNVSLFWVELP